MGDADYCKTRKSEDPDFADDHHPPHFHIVTPDHEVLVRLSDLEILAGSIDRRNLDRALAWVRENRKVLNEAWECLNER